MALPSPTATSKCKMVALQKYIYIQPTSPSASILILPKASLVADPTDPQPPPQISAEAPAAAIVNPEHLSTIQPAAPTSNAATPSAQTPARPTSMPPAKAVAHGGPTRQYLNQNVTPHLLEAMKYLAAYEPEKPLQWLSEFLRDRSREVEGT